jgi:aconitase B
VNTWKQAYLDYQNAGVATSNGEGVAVLKIREPQSYRVPFKGELAPHVHYRVCGEAGWMGRIKTVAVKQAAAVEGFETNKTDKNYKIINLADTSASLY